MRTSFIDTNILVYFAISDSGKSARAEAVIADGGLISVQVLNEFADVMRRKMRLGWDETRLALDLAKHLLSVVPITVDTHDRAINLASRYNLRIYDGLILASALEQGCDTLYTEDMHHGLIVEGRLRLVNPFA